MRFVIWKDTSRQWRWTLWAKNGRKVAACGEGYTRRAHAIAMCKRINPEFVVTVKETA